MHTSPSWLTSCRLLTGSCVLIFSSTASADDFRAGVEIQSAETSEDECNAENDEIPQHCKRGRFILKGGFTPDEGWILGAGVESNRLFGSDHRLSLSARVSERSQEARTDYDVPTLFGSALDFHAEAFTRKLAYRHFAQENTGVAMRFSRALSPNLSAFVGYRFQHAATERLPGAQAAGTTVHDPVNEAGILAAIEAGLRYDDRDARRMGSTASLLVSQSDRHFGSDYDLSRVAATLSHRTALVGPLSLDLQGYAESIVGRGGDIPLAERLQWGGHADVRGYGLDTTGPALGGDFKAGGKAELEFPLVSKWGLSGALFYDAGLIANRDPFGGGQFMVRQSVGTGLRWASPIGPVALDFALPLNDQQATPAVLISVGDSF